MNPTVALMKREWLQYRFTWMLLFLIPLGLAVLALTFGQVELETDSGLPPPVALAAGAMAVTLSVFALLAGVSGLIKLGPTAGASHSSAPLP